MRLGIITRRRLRWLYGGLMTVMTATLWSDLLGDGTPATVVVTFLFGVPCLYFSFTLLRLATLVASTDGLIHRSAFRTRTFRWSDISSFDAVPQSNGLGTPGLALQMHLRDGRSMILGDFWTKVSSHEGVSQNRTVQEARQLEQWRVQAAHQ